MKRKVQVAAYGFFWAVLSPLLLWLWCHQISTNLPALHFPLAGGLSLALGLLLWLAGVSRLRTEGDGLPMNAFPPPRLAVGGIYGLVPHPIYTGFAVAWAGLALLVGSAQALWLGTPLMVLVCAALVWGYERPDLARRFGAVHSPRPWIGLPLPGDDAVSMRERVGAMLAGVVPWAITYGGVKMLGAYPDAIETRMPWEWSVPIEGWTVLVYSSPYLLVPLAFLIQTQRRELRAMLVRAWLCTGIATLIYLTIPLTAEFRPPRPGLWSQWVQYEQLMAQPAVASWPSFHVLWALLVAQSFSGRWSGWLRYGWAAAVSLTCLTTGMHSLADVVAAIIMWLLLRDPSRRWGQMLTAGERLANAWRCWRIGPVRIIQHAMWAGLSGAVGLLVVISAAGQNQLLPAAIIFFCGLVGAALWAQMLESSSPLLRPFGYYGAVMGAGLGVAVVSWMGSDGTLLAGAFAVAAAPIQALGRLRCLEQGCCHGRPIFWGIKVHNSHSRVVAIGAMRGIAIHPTQIYSILGNLACAMLMTRMWALGVSSTLVTGCYLILAGALRFVEEAYRGEPQTVKWRGLPIYQWLALASLLAGMLVCMAPSAAAPGFAVFNPAIWFWATLTGLVCAAAMGVDLPESKSRYSRLSG